MNNICFIIAHKFIRGYKNYLDYYIDNIKKSYGDSALSVIIDNNSENVAESFDRVKHHNNLVLLDNNIASKFEVGAYTVGLKHILDNQLTEKYEYYVLSQDSFILKNRYDFNELLSKNIWACPFMDWTFCGFGYADVQSKLEPLGLSNNFDKCRFVFANSFIVHKSKISQLYHYLSKIHCDTKYDSKCAERFLSRIVFELNEHGEHATIDGDIDRDLHYDTVTVDPINDNINSHFVKAIQLKDENTTPK